MWETHLPLFVAPEAPHTIISICAWAKWLQNNNKLECFQDNIFHPLCTCCESPYKQHSPGEQDLCVLLSCPGLFSENEIVPNEFNNSGRLKHRWYHLGVRRLPTLFMNSNSRGFAFLNKSAVVSSFGQECWQLPGIWDSPTPPCKGTSEGLFLHRLPPLKHKGIATVLATCLISPPTYSG